MVGWLVDERETQGSGHTQAAVILEHLPLAVVALDSEQRFTYLSAEAARLLECRADEVLGKDAERACPVLRRSALLKMGAKALRTRSPVTFTDEALIPDKTIEICVTPCQGGLVATLHDFTELAKAQKLLKASEERYRTLLAVAQEGVWVVDANGITTYVNQRMADMLGHEPEEMAGRSFMDFIEPSRRSRARGMFSRHRRGESIRFEAQMLRKDASIAWVIVAVQPLMDTSGVFQGAIALITDISDRKTAEEKLRASEEHYRTLVEASPLAISVHRGGRIIFANAAAARLWGVDDPKDVLGMPVTEFVSPSDRKTVRERLERAAREKQPLPPATYAIAGGNGTTTHVRVVTIPITWEGEPALQSIVHDVTELVSAARALRDSESRYRRLLDSTPLPLGVLHADGTVAYANKAALRLLRFRNKSEVLGRPVTDFIHPDDRDTGIARVRNALASKARLLPSVELRAVAADGKIVDIESASMKTTWAGAPAVMITFRDMAGQKAAAQAQRDLMALVSHELRSPLAAMVGFATLLSREDVASDADTRRALLDKVRARADDMTRLVDELMEGARVDSDEFALELESCNLAALLDKTVSSLSVPPEVQVRLSVPDSTPRIRCDPERLQHAFSNLIDNAVKYSPEGAQVTVSARTLKDKVRIMVADKGPGISRKDLPLLFTRFAKTSGRPLRGRKGFGMGLYIAKRIVEAHGGSIKVESAPDEGTTFTIDLPR